MDSQVVQLEDEIVKITETVWSSTFGALITRGPVKNTPVGSPFLTTCIQITGTWEGTMVLECSVDHGRQLAATMFGMEATAVSQTEMHDAVGEVINIIGGNIKSLLPAPSQLSLPSIAEGASYHVTIPSSTLLHEMDFDDAGNILRIRLFKSIRAGHV